MSKPFEVITYKEEVVFDFVLPTTGDKGHITKEVILVWEGTFEEFLEKTQNKKPYKISTFHNEKQRDFFIQTIEEEAEALIDAVSEEISQKTKFGFEYTSPTYED